LAKSAKWKCQTEPTVLTI